MHVLVTGASGFIGSAACALLRAQGHALSALSRDPAATRRQTPALRDAHAWNPLEAPPAAACLEDVDAVLHLAGESVSGRWTRARMRSIRDSRVVGTRHLVEALAGARVRPRVLVSASAVGYYGERGEEKLTEDSPAGKGFLAELCRDWEAEAMRAEELGVRVVHLRTGIVLGPRGGALSRLLPLFRLGLGGRLGSGRQWWSWIHIDDVARLVLHLIDSDIHGPVNVVSPRPARQAHLARSLAMILRRPALVPAPAGMVRLALGGFGEELLSSARVVARRALGTGYRFAFPDLEGALTDLAAGRDVPRPAVP